MRSVIHHQFGQPADVLVVAEQPLPDPGPGEIRVRTLLASIHNHDLWTVRGEYGYKPSLPATGGSEAVGLVDALGAGVEGLVLGQRVAVAAAHGTWAEYFLASARSAVPVPASIADEAAAQLIAMPFSAMTLLDFLQVDEGDWVIQNTANGAVGKTLAMLAAARGVNVINLVRRDEGVAELRALDIGNAVSIAQPGWQDRVRMLQGDAPLRAAVDSIGGTQGGELLSLLGEGGLLVSFGAMGGQPMQLSAGDLIFKQAVVKGFWASKILAGLDPALSRRRMGELLSLVQQGDLRLPVEAVYGLDDIAQAVTVSLRSGRSGKVLLKP